VSTVDEPAHWEMFGKPLESVSELYHEHSKIRASAPGFAITAEAAAVMRAGFKTYNATEVLPLPHGPELQMPLGRAIQERRSVRTYAGTPLRPEAIGTLLRHAWGNGDPNDIRRISPSAGALFPLEVYAIVLQEGAIPAGVYHYDVRRHGLQRVSGGPSPTDLQHAVFVDGLVATSGVTFVIAAVFARAKIKYGERGYRFALLEAGHVAQSFALAAVALGLGSCTIGGFVDDRVHELLDVDGVDEAALSLVSVGILGTTV